MVSFSSHYLLIHRQVLWTPHYRNAVTLLQQLQLLVHQVVELHFLPFHQLRRRRHLRDVDLEVERQT